MRKGAVWTAIRGLLWTSVVVLFVLGSLLVASCQEKHEVSRVSEDISRSTPADAPTPLHPPEAVETLPVPAEEPEPPAEPEPAANEPEPAEEHSSVQPEEVFSRYEVVRGDNLWGISERFYGTHVYWELLADWNEIEDSSQMRPGQVLEIPEIAEFPHRLHLVQEGDNLTTISRAFYGSGEYWDRLADANGLVSADHVNAGAVIRIPHLDTASTTPADSTLLAAE